MIDGSGCVHGSPVRCRLAGAAAVVALALFLLLFARPTRAAEDAAAGAAPPAVSQATPAPATTPSAAAELPATEGEPWGSIEVLGAEIAPGETRELVLDATQSYAGAAIPTSVVVIRGTSRGSTLCLTGGIHGDELNGIEVVRQVVGALDAARLAGMVIAVPIVNVHGFQSSSRYLPDRRDLNRYFPGHDQGSSASRIAHALFASVIRHCSALVDLHSGSFHRTNLPQIRGDLLNRRVEWLARGFGAEVLVHNVGREGTLRRAATDAAVPAITYEAGEPMRLQRHEIRRGVRGIQNLMAWLRMYAYDRSGAEEPSIYYRSHWLRANDGGILVSDVEPGDRVESGQQLGIISDPVRKVRSVIVAPFRGRVIGMTLAPMMIPGYAAYYLGVESDWEGSRDHPGDEAGWGPEHPEPYEEERPE